jgi:hypothetical protein
MVCLKNGGILQNCCFNYYINRENDDSHHFTPEDFRISYFQTNPKVCCPYFFDGFCSFTVGYWTMANGDEHGIAEKSKGTPPTFDG